MFAELAHDSEALQIPEAPDATTLTPFLDMLDEAARIVRKHYPGARFMEADINYELFGSGWRFVFDVPATSLQEKDTHSTAILYNSLGHFQMPLQYLEAPWSGDQPIPLPLSLDLSEAEELARQAGYGGLVTSVCLRWVLFPGVREPHYILTIPDRNLLVFVGVNSREVRTTPLAM
jgi:hypothetical protein